LVNVQKRIGDRKIKLGLTCSNLLGSLWYEQLYGDRPVEPVLQRYVENELAKDILRGEFKDEDYIFVDTELTKSSNGQLQIPLKMTSSCRQPDSLFCRV
jgi:ATP-dependent Clp protease ATP-binding subunit ClpB